MIKTKTQILYSLLIAIAFSALFFYLLEALFADIFYSWINSSSDNLLIIMAIGFALSIVIAMVVNRMIWEKVSMKNHLVAVIIAIILTITIEFFLALMYLFYFHEDLGMEFSITIFLKAIIIVSYYAFSNITLVWIITQVIFSIIYTLLIYDYWRNSKPIVNSYFTTGDEIEYEKNTIINTKVGIGLYYLLSWIFNTILFLTVYRLYIHKLPQNVRKFALIFLLSFFGSILTTYIAFIFYKQVGNKDYRELESDERIRRIRNIISAIISTILTYFFIYSSIMAYAETLVSFFIIFGGYRTLVYIISDWAAVNVFKGG